jgi:hypothetical protein
MSFEGKYKDVEMSIIDPDEESFSWLLYCLYRLKILTGDERRAVWIGWNK